MCKRLCRDGAGSPATRRPGWVARDPTPAVTYETGATLNAYERARSGCDGPDDAAERVWRRRIRQRPAHKRADTNADTNTVPTAADDGDANQRRCV